MRNLPLALRAVILLFSSLLALPSMAADALVLGVQDYSLSPRLISLQFRDMANYLTRKLGQPVIVEPVQSYARYMDRAKQKRYAFMYGPPSMAMEANALAGYEPVAKIPGLLSAAFMSSADGDIAFPEDMKGKRIGFTDEDSMVTQLALADLRSKHIDPAKYFKSVAYYHDVDGIATAFKYKLIDVGVANTGVLTLWNNNGMDLNLIMQSKGVPHLTFAVRGDLPDEIKQAVAQALTGADKDKEAQSYFRNTGFSSFEIASLADYKDMLKLLNIR